MDWDRPWTCRWSKGAKRHGLATPEGRAADQQFHHTILEAGGNLAFASLSSSVGAAVQWTTHFKQHASKAPRDPLPEHEAVYHAIAAADPARAHAAMNELLRLALDDMAVALPRLCSQSAAQIAAQDAELEVALADRWAQANLGQEVGSTSVPVT